MFQSYNFAGLYILFSNVVDIDEEKMWQTEKKRIKEAEIKKLSQPFTVIYSIEKLSQPSIWNLTTYKERLC